MGATSPSLEKRFANLCSLLKSGAVCRQLVLLGSTRKLVDHVADRKLAPLVEECGFDADESGLLAFYVRKNWEQLQTLPILSITAGPKPGARRATTDDTLEAL